MYSHPHHPAHSSINQTAAAAAAMNPYAASSSLLASQVKMMINGQLRKMMRQVSINHEKKLRNLILNAVPTPHLSNTAFYWNHQQQQQIIFFYVSTWLDEKISRLLFQMSPLNNNTLTSPTSHASSHHPGQPQPHQQQQQPQPQQPQTQEQQQHAQHESLSSSPPSFQSSASKSSPTANDCLISTSTNPSSISTPTTSMTSVTDWTAALQRSAASQQMTTAFAGHGFAGMYGWY